LNILLLKIFIAPLLIALVTWAGRRYGPAVGGMLVGLPLTSAPLALIFALENGTTFAAESCSGILLGLVPVHAFLLSYALCSRRFKWPLCSCISLVVFMLFLLVMKMIVLSLLPAFIISVVSLVITWKVFPMAGTANQKAKTHVWELPVRMITAMVFILIISYFSTHLGPRLSGLLSPFPVYGTIFAASTHYFSGADATIKLLKGFVIGSCSFAVFFLILGMTIVEPGMVISFSLATTGALLLQFLVYRRMVQVKNAQIN